MPLSIYSRGEGLQYALVGTMNGLRADQNKARPFLPGIQRRFLGRPARNLVTDSHNSTD